MEFDQSRTFNWMPLSSFPLRDEFFLFFFPPLKLLYPLIVIEDSHTKDLLGPVLPDNELVEVLFEHFGG